MTAVRVLGISGSLRAGSHNTELLRAAGRLIGPAAALELYTGLESIPPYSEDVDLDPAPAAVAVLRDAIEAADALLIATPEYNGSIPGVLKNAVDWASRPYPGNVLRDKPAAVIGASTGMFGAVWAQAELRKVLRTAGADVIESGVAAAGADRGLGPETIAAVAEAVRELTQGIRTTRRHGPSARPPDAIAAHLQPPTKIVPRLFPREFLPGKPSPGGADRCYAT